MLGRQMGAPGGAAREMMGLMQWSPEPKGAKTRVGWAVYYVHVQKIMGV